MYHVSNMNSAIPLLISTTLANAVTHWLLLAYIRRVPLGLLNELAVWLPDAHSR